MSGGIDAVRAQLGGLEDVDMGGVPVAGDDGPLPPDDMGDPGPESRDPYDPEAGDDDPVARAAREPVNDVGNGNRLVIHFGDDMMFVPELGWHTWALTHWAPDTSRLAVRALAQRMGELIRQERFHVPVDDEIAPLIDMRVQLRARQAAMRAEGLSTVPGSPQWDEWQDLTRDHMRLDKLLEDYDKSCARRSTWAVTSGNTGKIDAMLTESQTRLQVPFDQLDTGALDINTESGLLRFSVDDAGPDGGGRVARVDVIAHARDQRLTKIAPVVYDPAAPCPTFDAFLRRIQPDRDMRLFLQRWLGLSMTALKTAHLAVFYGSGANGKSVLVDVIARILGGYATTLKIESITGTNQRTGAQATPDLVPLVGARYVRVSEPDQGAPLQEGTVKAMTGGEPIPVRPNYGAQFLLDPVFKLTMSGNHKPDVRGGDDGIWRRLLLVPFNIQIPASERDPALGEKLWAERAGIFRWLCEGLEEYLVQGLAPPAAVREATADYREESDPMGAFLVTCCEITGESGDVVKSRRLMEAFNYYLMEVAMNTRQATSTTKAFKAKSRQWQHPETGKRFTEAKTEGIAVYRGIRLRPDFAMRLDTAPRDQTGKIKDVSPVADPATPGPDAGLDGGY